MRAFPKRYIGDGAYVECSGWSLILTTEDGICTTNTVVIDMNDMPELQRAIADATAPYTAPAEPSRSPSTGRATRRDPVTLKPSVKQSDGERPNKQ